MRFLFGLTLGAVLTLFVANIFNVPTRALVEKGKTSWADFLLATGTALFEFPTLPAAAPAVAADVPLVVDELLEVIEPEVDAAVDPDIDLLHAPEIEPLLPVVAVTDPELATQTVWLPFRSKMSAEGFARRLAGKLDYPFSVNRDGPGRYQVMFSYASEPERLDLLDQVQSVTAADQQ